MTSRKLAVEDSTSTPKTQAERVAASDKALLEAAMTLILERGMDGTTLAAIGERAGYSRGLATYRFGSKAGLFQEVSSTIQRHWSEFLQAAVGDASGIDALCGAATAFHEFVNRFPQEIRVLHILYYGGAGPNSDVRGLAKQAFSRQVADAERWVEDGRAAGHIRADVDSRAVAAQYVAHIAGLTYIWLLNPGDINFTRIHEDFIRTLRERLAA
ncbi:MAG: helix-turn-helix domain-containing protein [Pseudomonadota bacterium]